jgi:hypothetical protein
MTSASSCAATITLTDGSIAELATRRRRIFAASAAASGYPTCVQTSSPREAQKTIFTASMGFRA